MINSEKDDLSIDKGDLIDIFAADVAEKEKFKTNTPDSSPKTTEQKKGDIINLPETKNQSTEKPDFKKEETISELILLVNEISGVLKSELKKFVNEKLIDNMLLRSLEKMALQSFLFKNSNWNAEGNLRTDGTIDVERVIKNYVNYKNEPDKIEKEMESCLYMLVSNRLKAIKAVFEKDKYENFITDFINKKNVMEQGHKKSTTDFFNERIFNKIIKGDE